MEKKMENEMETGIITWRFVLLITYLVTVVITPLYLG